MNKSNNNWVKESVIYEIYPHSFFDGSGDGVGDLQGILEKLDYLNDGTEKSLGIGAIWLTPIYPSPMVDFGYDVIDYKDINPLYGDMGLFKKLLDEVHKRGMKLILDFVPNHTSSKHPWFLESKSSKNNPKRDWYIWKDPKAGGGPPNNWLSHFGGSAWAFDHTTGQYFLHNYSEAQPDLNWRNEDVRRQMNKILKFWLSMGVDGFRVDTVPSLVEDSSFRDDLPNPGFNRKEDTPYDKLVHKYSEKQIEARKLVSQFCDILEDYNQKFMVTESHIDLENLIKMYDTCRHNTHIPFNFNLIDQPWDALAFKKSIEKFDSLIRYNEWPNYVMGNHDVSRIATRLGQHTIRNIALLLLTLRGTPFIYYGEEIGMNDGKILKRDVRDIFEKNSSGKYLGRDPERTPMQWSSGVNAGFSSHKPWIPVSTDFKSINVASEKADKKSVFNLYRKLIHFRNKSDILKWGSYKSVDTKNKNLFAYERNHDGKRLVIVINFSGETQSIQLPYRQMSLVLNTNLDLEKNKWGSKDNLEIRPNEGYLLKIS